MGTHGIHTRSGTLLDAVTATGPSNWIPIGEAARLAIQIHGMIAGDVVEVQVSVEEGAPTEWANVDMDGSGGDVTEDGVYVIDTGPRWLRLNFSDDTGGGTITGLFSLMVT